jgi:hypothetical protein
MERASHKSQTIASAGLHTRNTGRRAEQNSQLCFRTSGQTPTQYMILPIYASKDPRLENKKKKIPMPKSLLVSLSFPAILTEAVEGKQGFKRKGPSVLILRAKNWEKISKAYDAAQYAALEPFLSAQGDLDLSSVEAMEIPRHEEA